MTDTLNKTSQSCTVCNTPETDAEHERICESFCHGSNDYYKMLEFARKLERERDEVRFDLSFRRDLYRLQEERVKELEAEVKLWKENATSNRNEFDFMRRERDEAINDCQIWQRGHSKLVEDRDDWKSFAFELENALNLENNLLRKDLEHAKSYKKVMKEQHKQLTSRLEVLSKNNRKITTLLQEHGLAEYGN